MTANQLKITSEQEVLLKKYMPKYEDTDDFWGDLDDVMLDTLDENDDPTDETTVIAILFDQIWSQNHIDDNGNI